MIDLSRAFDMAWQRMMIILFRPLDLGKWGVIGFNAFLALLAEGGVSFNNPLASSSNQRTTIQTGDLLRQMLHAFNEMTTWLAALPSNPWLMIYVSVAGVAVTVWLVLNWVGCRGEFIFLDNIVRNRAALGVPWKRYERQGNIWFAFHLGLIAVTVLAAGAGVAFLLALNWSWIGAERMPDAAEIGLLVLGISVLAVLGLIVGLVTFLIRTMVLPLYFKQTMSLGGALLAVLNLVVARPGSVFLYVLASALISLGAALLSCLITVVAFCATCCLLASVACFPFVGSLLTEMVVCQLVLPVLVFKRCFQLSCLEQFGPQYDVFSVDLQTAGP